MIDAKTVSAIAAAKGLDPAATGIVVFYLPPGHPSAGSGAVAAMLGKMSDTLPNIGINAFGKTGFGADAESAAKALFSGIVTDAQTVETTAAADAAAAAKARQDVEAAVAADETAAIKP